MIYNVMCYGCYLIFDTKEEYYAHKPCPGHVLLLPSTMEPEETKDEKDATE